MSPSESGALTEFTFESLADLDEGRLRELWEKAVQRARLDCEDRPGVDRARKVTLHTYLVPDQGEDGTATTVRVSFEIQDTIPKHTPRSYAMNLSRGRLLHNASCPEDPNQTTLENHQKAAAR